MSDLDTPLKKYDHVIRINSLRKPGPLLASSNPMDCDAGQVPTDGLVGCSSQSLKPSTTRINSLRKPGPLLASSNPMERDDEQVPTVGLVGCLSLSLKPAASRSNSLRNPGPLLASSNPMERDAGQVPSAAVVSGMDVLNLNASPLLLLHGWDLEHILSPKPNIPDWFGPRGSDFIDVNRNSFDWLPTEEVTETSDDETRDKKKVDHAGFDRLFSLCHDGIKVERIYQGLDCVDLVLKYQNECVFLQNKNLHNLPRQLRGALVFVGYKQSKEGFIGIVLASSGTKSIVLPVLPTALPPRLVNMASEDLLGYYLQQIWGSSLLATEEYLRFSDSTMMSTKGPDLAKRPMGRSMIDKAMLQELLESATDLYTEQPRSKQQARLQKKQRKQSLGRPVLYFELVPGVDLTLRDSVPLYWMAVGPAWEYCSRKYKREFIGLNRQAYRELLKLPPLELEELEDICRKLASERKELTVPLLVNSEICIKALTQSEFKKVEDENSDQLVRQIDGFEFIRREPNKEHLVCSGGKRFIFATEETDSEDIGVNISHYVIDEIITRKRLTTQFLKLHLAVYKDGFGSRDSTECYGSSNQYTSIKDTGRPKRSPMQKKADVPFHQYYQERHSNVLIQPALEKVMHELALLAQQTNLDKKMAATSEQTCGTIIATTGRKSLAFCNESHDDTRDKFSKKEVKKLLESAKTEAEKRTLLLKNSGSPTTCGYQFVRDRKEKETDSTIVGVEQYFVMSGLGLAVEIRDGMCHRFLGSVFNHNTSICVGRRKDGKVTIQRQNDSFSIFAWGKGKKRSLW